MKKVALIAGASGAVGSEILKGLCESEHYNKVVALVRHELEFTHEKLEVKIVNFDDKEQFFNVNFPDEYKIANEKMKNE